MFSYDRIQTNLKRYAPYLKDNDFLHQIAAEECIASLSELSFQPSSVLILGHFPDIKALKKSYPNAKYTVLDGFHPDLSNLERHDLIISIGQLQWLNDPLDYLGQLRNLLNEGGVFYGICPGEDSFKELHKALIQAEMKLTNGAHQRLIPIISANDALNLLQAAKFKNPLVHVVTVELQHDSVVDVLKDLKHMGGGNPLQVPATTTPKHLFALANQFATKDSSYIETTVELIVMIAQA